MADVSRQKKITSWLIAIAIMAAVFTLQYFAPAAVRVFVLAVFGSMFLYIGPYALLRPDRVRAQLVKRKLLYESTTENRVRLQALLLMTGLGFLFLLRTDRLLHFAQQVFGPAVTPERFTAAIGLAVSPLFAFSFWHNLKSGEADNSQWPTRITRLETPIRFWLTQSFLAFMALMSAVMSIRAFFGTP
jgi:hypothetical protein